jgi:SAM-dependent methyltransferase
VNPAGLPHSAAAERNREPILQVLRGLLPPAAGVLEVASGTGQHAAHFAAARPGWTWQPTEADAAALPAIAARCAGLAGVRPPLALDVMLHPWPLPAAGAKAYDAVYCANLLHISPWPTCAALMAGAAQHLAPGGRLVLYGPYFVDGETPSPGNLAFDADLRARHPAWGLRRLAEVADQARRAGLALERRFEMPANNLMLVFRLGESRGERTD